MHLDELSSWMQQIESDTNVSTNTQKKEEFIETIHKPKLIEDFSVVAVVFSAIYYFNFIFGSQFI